MNEILKRLSIKGLNLETLSAFKIKQLVLGSIPGQSLMNIFEYSNIFAPYILGSIPARVQGIRVYERNTARDELVIDMEVRIIIIMITIIMITIIMIIIIISSWR